MTNSLPKLLITGGSGQLAQALLHHARASEFRLINCTRTDLDITDMSSIHQAISTFMPDVIINTAAYTSVDKAEEDVIMANLVNHIGAKNLAIACEEAGLPLFHISTDYVFDGQKNTPYQEHDTANPINTYGKSKWLGEQAVREHCHRYVILRTSGVFSEYGHNFFKTMLRLGNNKTDLRVVADQTTCPTYAGDIADAIFTIAHKKTHWGIYHYCSSPPVSWHHFAETILKRHIQAITTVQYPTAAKRPLYTALDCNKIAEDYGINQPLWQQAVMQLR